MNIIFTVTYDALAVLLGVGCRVHGDCWAENWSRYGVVGFVRKKKNAREKNEVEKKEDGFRGKN
jgi:hypothetical protein